MKTSKYILINFIETHNKPKHIIKGKYRYACKVCNKVFCHAISLYRHVNTENHKFDSSGIASTSGSQNAIDINFVDVNNIDSD